MKKGIPLVSNSGLRERILLSQQMRSPIFQIGVLYAGSNDYCTDHHTSHSDAISIGFRCFPRYQPKESKKRIAQKSEYPTLSTTSHQQVKFIFT